MIELQKWVETFVRECSEGIESPGICREALLTKLLNEYGRGVADANRENKRRAALKAQRGGT